MDGRRQEARPGPAVLVPLGRQWGERPAQGNAVQTPQTRWEGGEGKADQ